MDGDFLSISMTFIFYIPQHFSPSPFPIEFISFVFAPDVFLAPPLSGYLFRSRSHNKFMHKLSWAAPGGDPVKEYS